MKDYIVTAKATYQTSEYDWERLTITRTVDENTTVKEILDWIERNKADKNTIAIHPNKNQK